MCFFSKPALYFFFFLCICLGIQKKKKQKERDKLSEPQPRVLCAGWELGGEINSDANESVSNLLAAEECVLH